MTIVLGEIDVPSGILLLLDPGLGRFWRHDGDPCSPRNSDPQEFDLAIRGPDAITAGKAYDRQFDPRYLFDVKDVAVAIKHFVAFASEQKLIAHVEPLEQRITHVERARLAVETGGGAGVVQYNNLWAVAISGLPTDRTLQVEATPMPPGEFGNRWRSIDIVVEPNVEVAASLAIQGVMVEHGQIICSDLETFGEFKMWVARDGLADFIFWGKDAPAIAEKFQASQIDGHNFGWLDVPINEVHQYAGPLQDWIDSQKLQANVDYRPHCNLEMLNRQIRENEHESGQLELAGARVCGFNNRWGDGIFTIFRDFDADGRLIRIRLDVGSEDMQALLRRVLFRSKAALSTRKILDGESIRFAERLEPNNDSDSGWAFSAGTETQDYMDDPKNLAIVRLSAMLAKDPALQKIIESPIGSVYRRTKEGYVLDE